MEKKRNDKSPEDQASRVELSTPWGRRPNVINLMPDLRKDEFVKTRTDLHSLYITETERTRRLAMYLAAFLLAFACLIPIFAPAGRENLSYVIAAALFVFSAGAMGYTNIRYSSKKRRLELSRDGTDDDSC